MQIFIMRHGEAVMHAPSDAERALTENGKRHSIKTAQYLKTHFIESERPKSGLNIDLALVSPYLRAQQTLNAVLTVVDADKTETLAELTPGGNEERVADYLRALTAQGVDSVLIVSHLPIVGYLVSELCPDVYPPMFATSAVVSVTLSGQDENGVVDWYYHG